ncbi:MAG: pyruvate dehydrogenase (acetyl-transferring), homodimeric type [Gammaproteobacteria bacterium]|nr:pyruvate dehydrogenase (acetyl-transferring), homodimeric type [Gammaproteobacteria bacterium]
MSEESKTSKVVDTDSLQNEKFEKEWAIELNEWTESLQAIKDNYGNRQVKDLLASLQQFALSQGVSLGGATLNTPYRNTIPISEQPAYPGNIDLEQRIEDIIRWNAMAMVLQGYDSGKGLGGHISTYASSATMTEVALNHFIKSRTDDYQGDMMNIQAHASPGIYSRAFLEGRLSKEELGNFRRELQPEGGLPSYPHPRRRPEFWPSPTASMGLNGVSSIYYARFARYLENRGLTNKKIGKIWAFLGDGEMDEPETLGTINIASREELDNLVFVVNCNLQRLDGPVRGNGKIIQELEAIFRGSQWNVIKVIWGSEWDPLFSIDHNDVMQKRMDEVVDGEYQMYSVSSGEDQRNHWIDGNSELESIMTQLNDKELKDIKRGGFDHKKLYAAFDKASQSNGKPTVILVKTLKGYGLGEGSEGRNIAHQKKTMNDEERIEIAERLNIPLSDEDRKNAKFYIPDPDSEEMKYLQERRNELGGYQPIRFNDCEKIITPSSEFFEDFFNEIDRSISTTMVLVRIISKLLRDKSIGKYVVPIIPDEARTFGMDGLFSQAGIYSHDGQNYQPVDAGTISPYKEAKDGQILQEGICEAGAMASFMAAGTAYSHHELPMIPFYIFYSIFGFQRVGDMIWACGDALTRGFLIGGTAGRTTLNGEGVQHQDGHSHVLASVVPNLMTYDPAFSYELATIVREGIRRMYEEQENIFYYLTVYNENYSHPKMPNDCDEGILKGMYLFKSASSELEKKYTGKPIHLLGSGSIMQQVLEAQDKLESQGIPVNVWSVTSYNLLHKDFLESKESKEKSYIENILQDQSGHFVAVSDFISLLPDSLAHLFPGSFTSLGTDGYGLSEGREELRDYFGISANSIIEKVLEISK